MLITWYLRSVAFFANAQIADAQKKATAANTFSLGLTEKTTIND